MSNIGSFDEEHLLRASPKIWRSGCLLFQLTFFQGFFLSMNSDKHLEREMKNSIGLHKSITNVIFKRYNSKDVMLQSSIGHFPI